MVPLYIAPCESSGQDGNFDTMNLKICPLVIDLLFRYQFLPPILVVANISTNFDPQYGWRCNFIWHHVNPLVKTVIVIPWIPKSVYWWLICYFSTTCYRQWEWWYHFMWHYVNPLVKMVIWTPWTLRFINYCRF